MKRSVIAVTIICLCYGLSPDVFTQTRKTQSTSQQKAGQPQQNSAKPAKIEPARVLLRVRETGDFTTEGVMFMVHLSTAEDSNPKLKNVLQLNSGRNIKVERDGFADRERKTWKRRCCTNQNE